jgi:RNA polymerase sigma-70 factor (ECF subfamily)
MLPLSVKDDMTHLSDAALAQEIISGRQDAFVLLMRRHNRALFRAARSVLKDDAEAEDVLQDAYIQAYRSMDKFRAEAKLSTWLTRIVVNEAIARRRKTLRRAEIIHLDGDIAPENQGSPMAIEDHQTEQPEESMVRADTRRLLEQKIDELPENFRTVFVLRELEEMTVEEVSVALAIPEATVRTRHFRAKSMLRESLSREIDFALEGAFGFAGERCDRIVDGVLRKLNVQDKGEN